MKAIVFLVLREVITFTLIAVVHAALWRCLQRSS